MPFVTIPWIHTADPSDIWRPKRAFTPDDPFAIVMGVQTSSDVVESGLKFERVLQMVNPRQDPYDTAWYLIMMGEPIAGASSPTIDWHWSSRFDWGTYFAVFSKWSRYSGAIEQINTRNRGIGIFFVRGTVDVLGTDLFARSPEFWYKVRPK